MSLKNFLEFIEIRTKTLSVLAFIVGLSFTFYYFGNLNWVNTVLFFIAMFTFDIVTTEINNTMDFVKAKDQNYRDNINLLGREHISVATAATYIIVGLVIASAIGIYLVTQTNLLLLALGGLCFIIGIFYTFGPLPLSRLPLGEVFSGVTMGFGIPFIFAYVNLNDAALLSLEIDQHWNFTFSGSLIAVAAFAVATYPIACYIGNVMLANNLSDMETDIKNHRLTFPIMAGKKLAILTYEFLALSPYLALIVAVILKFLPITSLLTFFTLLKIYPNVKLFANKQDKKTTFPTSIQNATIFTVALAVTTIVGALINF